MRGWDGSTAGVGGPAPPGAPTLAVRTPRALRRLLWAPNEVGLGRAYVSGDLDIEGDLFTALTAYADATAQEKALGADRRALLRCAARLGALGPPPAPPPEELRRGQLRRHGRLHSVRRDRAAVSSHYDVSNALYRQVLGPSLVYSCAYWRRPGDPAYTLADAQRDKLELVCRKLGLHRPDGPPEGRRVLDVGCGWGSFALHAAREHGARVVGVTLSVEQAELARKRVAEAGLADRVEVRLQDYREVDDGPYDAVASIGMSEHVGKGQFGAYAATLHDLLRPGGRLLNHAIASRPGPFVPRATFIGRYVFPDGELMPVGAVVTALQQAGFEVRDVEALREHYARTLRQWVANLEAGWDGAVADVGVGRARVWRLYLAGTAAAFELDRIGVDQVLAWRPADRTGAGASTKGGSEAGGGDGPPARTEWVDDQLG